MTVQEIKDMLDSLPNNSLEDIANKARIIIAQRIIKEKQEAWDKVVNAIIEYEKIFGPIIFSMADDWTGHCTDLETPGIIELTYD